jgi:hypothetical protein
MGRGPAKAVHSDELSLYGNGDAELNVLDMMESNAHLPISHIEAITEREFTDMAEYEKFMEEPVVISVNETTDKNAPWVVPIGVNGDFRYLPRGIPIRVPRKFIERLAQAQETRLSTKQNTDHESSNAMRVTAKTASAYGFSVLRDPNPRGPSWLQRVYRQSC